MLICLITLKISTWGLERWWLRGQEWIPAFTEASNLEIVCSSSFRGLQACMYKCAQIPKMNLAMGFYGFVLT